MSKATDITRWNRAGLRRLRYVDANAATLLEEIRIRLAERFPQWQAMQVPESKGGAGLRASESEQETERQASLLARYQAPRAPVPDWGWEIARALARASHVLTEHLDAYANEAYLGTATQWENLRRLVEMIDYHPRPSASASTPLVLDAKPGARGRVGQGFAARYSPADGGAPIVFETLDELDIDSRLNALRPSGYGVNPAVLDAGTQVLELEGALSGIHVGEPLVLESEGEATPRLVAHVVENVVLGLASTLVTVTPALETDAFLRGRTRVHVRPRERLAPVGPVVGTAVTVGRVLRLKVEPQGLLPGDLVTLTDGQTWCYRRVTSIDGRRLELDVAVGPLILSRATVARPMLLAVAVWLSSGPIQGSSPPEVEHRVQVVGDWSRLIGQTLADPRAFEGKVAERHVRVVGASAVPVTPSTQAGQGYTTLQLRQRLGSNDASQLANPPSFLVPPVSAAWEVDVTLVADDPDSRLPASLTVTQPKGLAAGDVVVAVTGSQAAWGRVGSVVVDTDARRAVLWPEQGWSGRGGEDFPVASTRVFGQFQQVARLVGWNVNTTPLTGNAVPLEVLPEALRYGRLLVMRQEGGEPPRLTRVRAVQGGSLILADSLPAGSTVDNLVLHANVVVAGHGERRPERVLGSGDATRTNQSFVLRERDLSFVPDATRPSGVRADLDVIVEGRKWLQVVSLRDSGPTDPHYMVRVVLEGDLAVVFGDGRNGRRLPTGTNNVRVSFRVGSGLVGNLAEGSLVKPSRPHPLVEAVGQPLRATGGNDMEGVEALRRSAPATVLSLERAVSTSDFASLAEGHSSVWQALSFLGRSGDSRQQRVEVVVVPADGGGLGSLRQTLKEYLQAHAVPGVEVEVSAYKPQPVRLDVTVEVDTRAYNPDTVVKAVREVLAEALSLRRRELGQPLYLSDVYKVVEAVPGVENSVCVMDGTPGKQRLDAWSRAHVIHLEAGASGLTLNFQEYSL
ncbi:hypothetical protein CYFUS_004474 [Cystobacter fuscus]|uniref:Baseplate protein J-like domain-containing protein n=1 Tax=Cystobacter fuscus TaxID=43 RepID=A0A250J524_9BACT|nr:baseplate J/gp47 family protein [Cystobacter fuscus]ATB39035.1 hypothetical protein CYFUS_004474 [Cystobacter fuscus]